MNHIGIDANHKKLVVVVGLGGKARKAKTYRLHGVVELDDALIGGRQGGGGQDAGHCGV